MSKYILLFFLILVMIGCGDYRQRDTTRRAIDSAESLSRRVDDMRYNRDIYSKIDNFFYILDDLYDTSHYAKESLKYSLSSVEQRKIKEVAAYFTANDPYPNEKKDLNYCKKVANFFMNVINLKNQNMPKNRVKIIIQNSYNKNSSEDLKKRAEIANDAIDKLYTISSKIDPPMARNYFEQGCLEVDFK